MIALCILISQDLSFNRGFGRDMERCGVRAYRVEAVGAALELAGQWGFDAVLLDGDTCVGPVSRSLSVLRERVDVPILLLTDRADEDSQIGSLESGATDVLAKPVSARLAAAKLRSLIEYGARTPRGVTKPVSIGPLHLDPRRAVGRVGEANLALTRTEFELLLVLAAHPGELVPRHALGRALYREGDQGDSRCVDMHVSRIRRKLAQAHTDGLSLETVHGRGYALRLAIETRPAATMAWAAM